jgi:glycosyltransferase involved in cell wall biosynthesis
MARAFQMVQYHGSQWLARALARCSRHWPPYSRLLVARDYAGWTLDVEAQAVMQICRRLRIPVESGAWMSACRQQAVFHADQFVLLNPPDWCSHRVAIAYYHGFPGMGIPEFDRVYENLSKLHGRISRIQVSHAAMRNVVLGSGIDPDKVQVIPIGFHREWFRPPTSQQRKRVRARLGFPPHARVVGSFQKDGVGWGEGFEPKLIKGPDVFVEAMKQLHARVPELHVLLTGPSRGYVMRGLAAAGIPYHHVMLRNYRQTANMYHALDAYVVSSRQEGGPKAVLESMATNVPLISTRVGQASDLVCHGENGCLVDVDDVEGIVHWTERVLTDKSFCYILQMGGARTAAANCYEAQSSQWKIFMRNLLDGGAR